MSRTEKQILLELRDAGAEAERLFSNAGQPEQERTAVAGLLRSWESPSRKAKSSKPGPSLSMSGFATRDFR
jgi:hypothetical protein